MSTTEKELEEFREQQVGARNGLARERMSRRTVLRGATILAAAGSGGAAALLAACSSGTKGTTSTSPATSNGGSAASKGSFKDTTGLPPYKLGIANATVDAKWQQFPYVYKYNWRRYPFNAPVTTGGHQITTTAPPSNYDLMKTPNGVPGSLYYQGLWHTAIHSNINLDSTAIEPDLALKTAHNADFTTWTFTIPQGVKFHDIAPVNGRELTADDVVFAFQRYIDTSIWSKQLQFVEKVSAPDSQTVRFDMKQPQVTFDAIVALPYYTVFAKEAFADQKVFTAKPIGTGAFMNESSVYQVKAEAVRNSNSQLKAGWMSGKYKNAPLPFMDRLTLQYYASDASARSAFIAGQVDDYAVTYIDPAILKDVITARPDILVTVNSLWATFPIMFFWNYKNPLFQDLRVRRALSMALDRDAIMKNVFQGAGVPGGAPVAFDLLGEQLPPPLSSYGPYYQYNPKGAQQLMKEAGHENGFQLHFDVDSSTQQLITFQAYKAVQQYWRQNLKVDLVFDIKDPLTVLNDGLNHSYPDLHEQTAVTGYDAYSLITPIVHTGGGGNYGLASDSTLDGLLDQLGSANSQEKVLSLTKQALARIQDQVTFIWLGWPQAATLTQPWVHGETQNLYAYLFYFGIENFRNVWIDQTAPGGRGGKPI